MTPRIPPPFDANMQFQNEFHLQLQIHVLLNVTMEIGGGSLPGRTQAATEMTFVKSTSNLLLCLCWFLALVEKILSIQ